MSKGWRKIYRKIVLDRQLSSVSHLAERLFDRLIPMVDECGRHIASPDAVKMLVMPFVKVSLEELLLAINELARAGLVTLYTDDREYYLVLRGFEKLQSKPKHAPVAETPDPKKCLQVTEIDTRAVVFHSFSAEFPQIQETESGEPHSRGSASDSKAGMPTSESGSSRLEFDTPDSESGIPIIVKIDDDGSNRRQGPDITPPAEDFHRSASDSDLSDSCKYELPIYPRGEERRVEGEEREGTYPLDDKNNSTGSSTLHRGGAGGGGPCGKPTGAAGAWKPPLIDPEANREYFKGRELVEQPEELILLYNLTVSNLPKATELDERDLRRTRRAIAKEPSLAYWWGIFTTADNIPELCGKNPQRRKASFRFLVTSRKAGGNRARLRSRKIATGSSGRAPPASWRRTH